MGLGWGEFGFGCVGVWVGLGLGVFGFGCVLTLGCVSFLGCVFGATGCVLSLGWFHAWVGLSLG